MKLDWKKIEEFEADFRNPEINMMKKYGHIWSIPHFGLRNDWTHMLYTLKAHARGRIHARKIGKVCTYAPRLPREKGSGFVYPILTTTYRHQIDTLESQAALYGKFFKQFEAAPEEQAA